VRNARTIINAETRSVILVFACLAGAPAIARAQTEAAVRGRVILERDGSVLPHARVTLQEDDREPAIAATDEGGAFTFSALRPGSYTLAAEHEGFLPAIVRFVLKPREVKLLDVALAIRPLQEQVEVRGPATLASTFSPSSTVVQTDVLTRLPPAQRTTLPEAIAEVAPGMIRGHDDFVHVRGQELALNPLINGVGFWENPHTVFSGGISPDVIDTANVMTGGFPAEYGNRFGGVVDIVTKSGFGVDSRGSITVDVGQAGRRSVSGDIGGHTRKVAYYVFGSAFETDRFLSPPDPAALHDDGWGRHGFLQLDAAPSAADSLRLTIMGDATDFDVPVTPVDQALRPAATASQQTRQQTAIAGWTRVWSSRMLLHTSVYERWSRAQLFPASGPLTAVASADRRLLTLGAKADFSVSTSAHSIKAGVDVVRLRPFEQLFYDGTGYRKLTHLLGLPHVHVVPVSFEQERWGGEASAYVQDAIRLGGALTANVGVRVDHYGLVVTRTHASPRLNLAYRFGPAGTVAHASYNHFFVPPPIENLLSSSAGLTRDIAEIGRALPPLPPTVENQVELGVAQPLAGGVQLAVTSYYRRGRDEVHTTVWPDARIYSYASFDRSQAYGLETRVDAPLRRLGVAASLNYALGRVYFYGPVTGGFITEPHHIEDTGRFLAPMDQTHTLTAGATYRHARTGAWTGVAVEYGSGTPLETEEETSGPAGSPVSSGRVPGHVLVNLSAGADLWRTSRGARLGLRVDVENVAGRVYKLAQESVFTPGQYSIPRLVSIGLSARF